MQSIIAATAIDFEAALQAAAMSPHIPPPPGREFRGNCMAVGNFIVITGGERVRLVQGNENVWNIFWLRISFSNPATNGRALGTRPVISDRNTLMVCDSDTGIYLNDKRLLMWRGSSSTGRSFADVDVSHDASPAPVGGLPITLAGRLRFRPARTGIYQLQFSTNPHFRSDEESAFQATQGPTVSFTDKIIPWVPQKHCRISAL